MAGKQYRKGITLAALFDMFPDDEAAEAWFVKSRWPDGIRCAHCESDNINASVKAPCSTAAIAARFLSQDGNAFIEGGYQKWAIAIYLMTTNLKGVSSMKLHRDIGVTQKSRTASARLGKIILACLLAKLRLTRLMWRRIGIRTRSCEPGVAR